MCSSRTLFLTLTVVATAHSALHYPPPLCCGWTTRGDEGAADLTKHDSDGAIFPFVLALRESEASIAHIKDVALAVSDPGSPTYGQHLSADEIAAIVAPPASAVAAVTSWLGEAGLRPTQHRGARITVGNATAAQVRLLHPSAPFGTLRHPQP